MEKPNILSGGVHRNDDRYCNLFRNAPISLLIGDGRGLTRALEGVAVLGVKTPEDFSKYLDDHPEFLELILDSLVADEANDACAGLLGARNASELSGPTKQLWRTRPDTVRRAIESRFRGEQSYQERTQIDGVDGRLVDVIFATTRTDSDTTLLSFVDITELARAEGDSTRLAAIVASSDDAIISKDLDGTITSWNAGATTIFGYGAGEMIGQSIMRLVPAELRGEEARILKRIRKEGRLRHFETVRLDKDGRRLDVSLTISPLLDRNGMVAGASTVARDISSQSERRYRHLFHVMPIPLWQLDVRALSAMFKEIVDAGITDFPTYLDQHPDFVTRALDAWVAEQVNEAAVRMFAASDRRELLGSIKRFFEPSMDTFRRVMESRWRNEATFSEKTQLLTQDGRLIDALVHIARTEPGVSLLGVVEITDLVHAQRELERVQAEFAHAARVSTLGELTATIAHEVNQPLAGLVNSGNAAVRWLASTPPNLAAARESIDRMINAGSRAADVITRIRAMVAKSPPEHTLVSVNEVINDVIVLVQGELRHKRIALQLNLDPSAPTVQGDRIQLQQVMLNLVMNAMEAMSEIAGGHTLSIASRLEGDAVMATVRDTGVGFDQDAHPRLFDTFYTTKKTGVGLGLPLCQSIIQAHGGRLEASHNQPRGAVFQFMLPICCEQAP